MRSALPRNCDACDIVARPILVTPRHTSSGVVEADRLEVGPGPAASTPTTSGTQSSNAWRIVRPAGQVSSFLPSSLGDDVDRIGWGVL